ncbi:Uncharacterized protein FWK35_00033829 [Aphis craccivora]|uniref:HAT C-terminal dimerisation domain-containing protein n=1 Tax=Aphis craccivora TaxID=307492 RepID=A0A6G0W6J5_APHCR|nr:Uncharacterized protein FWK35_00033829 [Aphis craccivora]
MKCSRKYSLQFHASVIVGINNGVYTKLKEKVPSLIHILCVCHSLQLAVSAAASATLPRNIDYLIKETYNWFSHSTLRQAQYKNLYSAINVGHNPLKIVKSCDTRWLSIETAVGRILTQWIELKTLFGIDRQKEKCYLAEVLYEVQMVNKSFESNNADPNPLVCNMDSYISPNIQWPYEFTQILQDTKSSEEMQNLTHVKWIEKANTIKFWQEVAEYSDASGLNPYNELLSVAIKLLSLPWSNADVERLFSQINIVKTKLRNRMGPKLLDSISTIKAGLRRVENVLLTVSIATRSLNLGIKSIQYISISRKSTSEQ